MTILGIVLVAATVLLDASPTVALIGMMLLVAGAVKIAVVRLWHSVAGFGATVSTETASSSVSRKE